MVSLAGYHPNRGEGKGERSGARGSDCLSRSFGQSRMAVYLDGNVKVSLPFGHDEPQVSRSI